MWQVVAGEGLKCNECRHEIPSEAMCISQMPSELPDGFLRGKFENFCIDCKDCEAAATDPDSDLHSCYERSLDHWYTPRARTSVLEICAGCGDDIPEKTWALVQKFYAWPESEGEAETGSADAPDELGGISPSVITGLAPGDAPAHWSNLSAKTRWRFRTGGLGRGLGSRSPRMAQRVYEKEVPRFIRNMDEPAVRAYLKGKHFSHRISVRSAPGNARAPANVVLEKASANLTRGSRNMSSAGLAAAKKSQRISAIKVAGKSVARDSAKAGAFAAAAEAAISVPENLLHYRRGRKTGGQAVKDTAKSTASAVAIGVATTGAAKVVAMAGVGLTLGAFGTPVMIAGGLVFAGTAIRRVHKAAKHDLPMDEFRMFICKEVSCRRALAQKIAAPRQQSSSGSGLSDVLARIARDIRNRIMGVLRRWFYACCIMWPYVSRRRHQFTR